MKAITYAVAVLLLVATTIGVVTPASAQTTSYGGGSVQGYAAENPIENGTIVQLSGPDKKQVKPVGPADLINMFGVSVDRNELPITITDESLKNETFVAVSGTYNVLVSDQAGAITAGDYVTLSSITGVAMNAGSDETTIFGRSVGAFDGKSNVLGTKQLKGDDGKLIKTVAIGSIPVTIGIQRNPNIKSTKTNLPDFLERAGQAIAEKEVSPLRMYLSLAILTISIITAIVVLYSGIRSGVISIGRNPMSRKSIFRALVEIILTCLLILIIGLFAVYLLLKL